MAEEPGFNPGDRPPRKGKPADRGKLKIGDDWNAIRIIALSQSNPLKAIAEFVEKSINAHSKTITITRGREHGKHYLSIKDDGEAHGEVFVADNKTNLALARFTSHLPTEGSERSKVAVILDVGRRRVAVDDDGLVDSHSRNFFNGFRLLRGLPAARLLLKRTFLRGA